MIKKPSGLGRGLQSLIPTAARKTGPEIKDNVYYVEVSHIRPNTHQPRTDFDEKALADLAASVKKYGVLQPLLVSKVAQETAHGLNVEYEIIAGERRWRAAKLAGLPQVPVIVKDNIDEDRAKLEVALVENVQREDLNAMEEAEAYARLASEFKLTQQEIANKVGKSREVVANAMRLLNLPASMKQALRSGKLSKSQARALLAFADEGKRQEAFKAILTGGINIRMIEEAAKAERPESAKKPNLNGGARFQELQTNLAKTIGAPVLIRNGTKGGSIVVKFATLEDLNNIVKAILD